MMMVPVDPSVDVNKRGPRERVASTNKHGSSARGGILWLFAMAGMAISWVHYESAALWETLPTTTTTTTTMSNGNTTLQHAGYAATATTSMSSTTNNDLSIAAATTTTSASSCPPVSSFQEWYETSFSSSTNVPFTSDCLKGWIDATNETNFYQSSSSSSSAVLLSGVPQDVLNMIVALVRRHYPERLANAYPVPNHNNNNATDYDYDRLYLFYSCKGICSGLGDRLRGAANIFALALSKNVPFGVNMESPAPLDDVFTPFQDMDGKKAFLTTSPVGKSLNISGIGLIEALKAANVSHTEIQQYATKKQPTLQGKEFTKQHKTPGHVSLWKTNMIVSPSMLSSLYDYRLDRLKPWGMLHVFLNLYLQNPTPWLRAIVDPTLDRMNTVIGGEKYYLIGMQIRLGYTGEKETPSSNTSPTTKTSYALGWKDPVRHTLDSVPCMIEQAQELCVARPDWSRPCAIWVSSDAVDAITAVESVFGAMNISVFYGDGIITHIDRSDFTTTPTTTTTNDNNGNDATALLNAQGRTFQDWYILAQRCDALVLSRSGFGTTAALYAPRHRPFVQLKHGTICTFYNHTLINN